MKPIRMIDVHSHLSTAKGYTFRPPKGTSVRDMEKHYKAKGMHIRTEAEMAQDFIDAGVKSIPLELSRGKPIEEIREINTYLAQLPRDYPDAFIGSWCSVSPKDRTESLRELERCIKDLHMTGLTIDGVGEFLPYNHKLWYPFYTLCWEANFPVLIHVGTTGLGAGSPGGGGYYLDYDRPIPYLDEVAADFPELNIIASRPAYPWQSEMIAVLVHKPNVTNDVHGWSPKYFTPELKKEINGRLQDRFITGIDYPMFAFDRMFGDWEAEGYKPEVIEKVFIKNAQRVLGLEL